MKTNLISPCRRLRNQALAGAALVVCACANASATTEWEMHKTADGTRPSGIEQQMMWFMNRARANPVAESEFLAGSTDPITVLSISTYRVKIPLMKAEFAVIPARSPAAFDRRLHNAARQHSEYMIRVRNQTHAGQGDLMRASGFLYTTARLGIFAYSENAEHAHAMMNIDIGPSPVGMQPGRVHRQAIMSHGADLPLITSVGLAMVPENNPSTEIGPYVFSGDYVAADIAAGEEGRFLVGTVWTDLNGNSRYDIGEGLSGVTVQTDKGSWHAMTGVAGGYAVPVTESGTYRVTFSGGTFPGTYSRNITVGEVSVLVDAETTTLPTVPTVLESSISFGADQLLHLTWSGGSPPYQVQRTRNLSGEWSNYGEPTDALSVSIPPEGASGFLRVIGSL